MVDGDLNMKKKIKPNPKEDFWYEVKEDGITIEGYKGKTKDVVIPDEIDGLPVVVIGGSAFKGAFSENKLTNVIIPDSVKTIEYFAFGYNELTNVIIPSSVQTIGSKAFAGNKLMNVIIPDSVKEIDDDAFFHNISEGAENPFSIMVYKNKITITGYNHDKENVVIPKEIDGLSVAAIGCGAFDLNRLTDIVIPDSVETIGRKAFEGNQLTNVIIPDSVKTIGDEAFARNKLT